MARPGLEEHMSLSDDVAREFGHVKESYVRIEQHLAQQDRGMSDHFKKFGQHVIDDNNWAALLRAHLAEHVESRKHRWIIVSGIFLTAVSTFGMLAVELIKHIWSK